jgi:hypothetical protein
MKKLRFFVIGYLLFVNFVKMFSKPQILAEGKARFDSKAERTGQYVSILNRIATQPSGKR